MQNPRNPRKQPVHKSRKGLWRVLIVLSGLFAITGMAGVAGVIGAYLYVAPGLPAAETIRDIPFQIPLRIYSRDGYLIEEIGQRRRILIRYDDVPDHVVNAFIAAEDQRFFVHPGIDYRGIMRALTQLVLSGEIASGGSTLTQQLARSYFLSLEQTAERKFKEASLAVRIEQEFSKEQIMELFLNKMFFGQRAYGVAAAAQVYFNKPLDDLTIAEAATLAGVLPAPSRYNPVRSPVSAKVRRGYVLGRMLDLDYISEEDYAEAMDIPMESKLHGTRVELNAPYVAEMVRREMLKRYGEETYTAGYQVVTSLDSRLQVAGNYALRNGLLEFTRRRGYKGPIASVELSDDFTQCCLIDEWPVETLQVLDQYAPGWTVRSSCHSSQRRQLGRHRLPRRPHRERSPGAASAGLMNLSIAKLPGPAPQAAADVLQAGDVIYVMPTAGEFWALAQVPEAQAAVVSMDPLDGAITSLVGGFDFATTKFNRATQAARQPGSSFKPFIYSAALEHGNTPATVVLDAPVVINSSELEAVWRPINYSGTLLRSNAHARGSREVDESRVCASAVVRDRRRQCRAPYRPLRIRRCGIAAQWLARAWWRRRKSAGHGAGLRDDCERRLRRQTVRHRRDLRVRGRNALPGRPGRCLRSMRCRAR